MTAIKDAGGNRAPWSTTGSINLGLHYEEPTRELYRTQGLNLRIAYNGMANAYDGNEYNREVAVTENAEGFAGDDMLRYLGPGEDMMATMPRYEDFARYAAAKRLSVETHVGGNIDNIIAGMEAANAVYPISKLKWRIAHPNAGEPSDAQLDRAKAAGAAWVLTVLPIRNGGPGPRYRSVAQNSTHFCMGTDAMNGAPWEPFMGMWYLISGKTMLPGVAGVPRRSAALADGGAGLAHPRLRLVPRPGGPPRLAGQGLPRRPDRPERRLLHGARGPDQGPHVGPDDRRRADRALGRRLRG